MNRNDFETLSALGITPEDVAAVDQDWLADMLDRARRGEAPPLDASDQAPSWVMQARGTIRYTGEALGVPM
jgi:hypothetical protein